MNPDDERIPRVAPRSVPMLYATAHGISCEGPHRCFYCGAPCGEARPAALHVKDSFTGRPGVRAPGSPWVCEGCVLCLREDATLRIVDGTSRRVTRGAVRAFSWVVTADYALAGSKAHLATLRGACLGPPPPPWAIVLSDSGQTHQLYRGVVNHGPGPCVVTLEAEPIGYRPGDLASRLRLCGRVAAATGKPALREPVDARVALAVIGRYRDGEAVLSEWSRVQSAPLSRLAAWLCPNKEESAVEHPDEFA